jgi:hypothetical protein
VWKALTAAQTDELVALVQSLRFGGAISEIKYAFGGKMVMVNVKKAFLFLPFAYGAVLLCGISFTVVAQAGGQGFNPCETRPGLASLSTDRLAPGNHPMIVYDSNQAVCWLGDANLAGDPDIRAMLGVTGIDPNGAMDYAAALKWVAALNAYDNGWGYLGHNNWQLPVTPLKDNTCADTGSQGGSFGPLCTGSALGNLYYMGLNQNFPNSVAPHFGVSVGPFHNIKLSYYWALQNNGGTGGGAGGGGQEIFSFANGIQGGTTTKDSYYYVLPMVAGAIDNPPGCPSGFSGVLPYMTGPAAQKAVYDCNTGYTWAADANLADSKTFGINGDTEITYASQTITAPLIDKGAMLFQTANLFIQTMNNSAYLSSSAWQMPASSNDLETLFADLNMAPGDALLMWTRSFGPFQNIQPFFYWGCQRDQSGNSQSPCTGYAPPDGAKQLQWTFNFDYGFQSTSALIQRYFVMVYYPAPIQSPPH